MQEKVERLEERVNKIEAREYETSSYASIAARNRNVQLKQTGTTGPKEPHAYPSITKATVTNKMEGVSMNNLLPKRNTRPPAVADDELEARFLREDPVRKNQLSFICSGGIGVASHEGSVLVPYHFLLFFVRIHYVGGTINISS